MSRRLDTYYDECAVAHSCHLHRGVGCTAAAAAARARPVTILIVGQFTVNHAVAYVVRLQEVAARILLY